MRNGYGSHREYMKWVKTKADERIEEIGKCLKEAFQKYIEVKEVEIIVFSKMSLEILANAIYQYPTILKPLLAICNIAARTIEVDLDIRNLDTYHPRIREKDAYAIAGYIKPDLPSYAEIPSLLYVDKVEFIDKEVRKIKGQWEKRVIKILNGISENSFKKRKFISHNEEYEIDAAFPAKGQIQIGIDIKRIEARRDTHKRCDEIVNKAHNLKSVSPNSYFVAFIYYPFIDEHINLKSRLEASDIDLVVFASDDDQNIRNACESISSSVKRAKSIDLEHVNIEAFK